MKCQILFTEKNKETICMKCQILFTEKNKKNIVNLSSSENAQRVVKVKLSCIRNVLTTNFLIVRFQCTTVNPLYTDIRYDNKIRYNDDLNVTKPSLR